MENEVLDAIYRRRSVRKYSEKEVPEEIVKEIINAGIMAPSAMNKQPWHFSVVQNREKMDELSEKALAQRKIIGKIIGGSYKAIGLHSIFYKAPLLIVISGKKDYDYLKEDVNLAVQNMFLSAYSLGLGSCWIGMVKNLNKDKSARKELGVPENFEIMASLIFGYQIRLDKNIPKEKVRKVFDKLEESLITEINDAFKHDNDFAKGARIILMGVRAVIQKDRKQLLGEN